MTTPILDTGTPGDPPPPPPPDAPGGDQSPPDAPGGDQGGHGQPQHHRTQPKRAAARQNIVAWKPEDRPAAYKPATQAHPTYELAKLAGQHGGVVAQPDHAHRGTRASMGQAKTAEHADATGTRARQRHSRQPLQAAEKHRRVVLGADLDQMRRHRESGHGAQSQRRLARAVGSAARHTASADRGQRHLEAAASHRRSKVDGIKLPHLTNLTVAVVQQVAFRLGLRATKAEIAFSLRPGNIVRAVPSLILAAGLFDLTKFAAAKPYDSWGRHYDLTNGAPDAFLHAAYAGLLALRYGEAYAKTLTTLHETGTPQKTLLEKSARTMDLHNNGVGIKLALAIEASPPPADIRTPTFGIARNQKEAELLALLLGASRPGSGIRSGLVTLGPPGSSEAQVKRNPTLYSLQTGRPTHVPGRG
jgi:hypothetical protein